jgi:type II secretory pathway pseudopilin PulG
MSRVRAQRRRGFTLLEAIAVVLVLALAVPTGMRALGDAIAVRRQAAVTARAVSLAGSVLEQVIADVHSGAAGRGFAGFADAAVYLSDPATGLYARLDWVSQPYEDAGLSYTVSIGALGDSAGTATGNAAQDVYRRITVTVVVPDVRGGTMVLPVSTVVSDLG